ncbi:MAG: hypothetical protein EZS28_041445, partial [Streblomastix strix]
YAKLKDPIKDKITVTNMWPYQKIWIASQTDGDGALIGVGSNLSYEYAEKALKQFETLGYLPENELERIEQSSTPYRRPPYSFVGDGFLAVGDSACVTTPWGGEGVPYAWLLCQIASEEFGKAMKEPGILKKESVWNVNLRYQELQGALFAKNLALLPGALSCKPEENDYEFKKSIIVQDESEQGQGWILINAYLIGEKIFKHYMNYPKDPTGMKDWIEQADALWKKTVSMATLAEEDLALIDTKIKAVDNSAQIDN